MVAVVGDFGYDHPYVATLGSLVSRLEPDAVVTTGDNLQIRDVGSGLTVNRFFPAAGNYDHADRPLRNYLDYFDLPGPPAGLRRRTSTRDPLRVGEER